ncbi:carboxypeptidase regulatory-like domain-containing protein [Hymenobacter koreensis]|uniref:Carboxypeptidase regulatory-like domain-containing protein n=1 Tax=Hymenobacter koreensis TaxID=1084523 RepID=A0ABP8JJ94_9BACT
MRSTAFYLLCLGFGLAPACSWAQNSAQVAVAQPNRAAAPAVLGCNSITGRVTDENGKPLAGATVMLRGSHDAASTNGEGRFLVPVKTALAAGSVLEIGSVGYASRELQLSSCQEQEVSLLLLPGTKLKSDGRVKKTSSTGKIR